MKYLCKLHLALSEDLKDFSRLAKSVPKPTARSRNKEQNHKSVFVVSVEQKFANHTHTHTHSTEKLAK